MGQVSLPVAGGEALTLEFSIDALCQLEGRLGQTARQIEQRVGKDDSLSFLRSMLWAALREHHPSLNEKQAGELIRRADDAAGKVLEAYILSFPLPADTEGEESEGADPQKTPEGGIGPDSTASGAS